MMLMVDKTLEREHDDGQTILPHAYKYLYYVCLFAHRVAVLRKAVISFIIPSPADFAVLFVRTHTHHGGGYLRRPC